MRQLLVTVFVITLLSGDTPTIAAQKVTTTPASFTFADRTIGTYGVQDRITSDGLGPYSNGTGSVTCVLFSSTGDAHLDTTGRSSPLRALDYDPSQVISGSGPTASFVSTGSVDI